VATLPMLNIDLGGSLEVIFFMNMCCHLQNFLKIRF